MEASWHANSNTRLLFLFVSLWMLDMYFTWPTDGVDRNICGKATEADYHPVCVVSQRCRSLSKFPAGGCLWDSENRSEKISFDLEACAHTPAPPYNGTHKKESSKKSFLLYSQNIYSLSSRWTVYSVLIMYIRKPKPSNCSGLFIAWKVLS